MLSPVTVLPTTPRRSSAAAEPDPQVITVEISIVIRSGVAATEQVAEFTERLSALAAGVLHQECGPANWSDASFGDDAAAPRRLVTAPQPARPELLLRPVRRTAQLRGEPVTFTRREYDLLLHLARHPHQVLTRGQLLREVWGYEMCRGARTVDVHVRRLREKLAGRGPVITTVHGVGYRLDETERLRVAAD
ncbi:winged helix-turn-helix domain-containing protein [Micromonospora vulcania]|uniref:Winged helix-turn-helix domain-containing protein n=1 Tax=Micromonospora vulcania TaxID=1441873 RepID=A0ABW1H3P4_9ACTN